MPEDYTAQRRELAHKAIEAATAIVEGVWALVNMGPELAQKGGGFSDADFDPDPRLGVPSLSHVNAWKMNMLVNVVAPALSGGADAPISADSPITHKDILLAVKLARRA